MRYEPVSFDELAGWADDDHRAALRAFRISAAVLAERLPPGASETDRRLARFLARLSDAPDDDARAFFEREFSPHRVTDTASTGLLTGYFEPEIAASRTRSAAYSVPLHRRPTNLVNIVPEASRATPGASPSHMLRDGSGLMPAPTRRAIDEGALDGQGLEFLYVADPVDRFIMQVQGSAALRLTDGNRIRVGYDGKNGFPYTSIGRVLIERGILSAEDLTLDTLVAWLKADPARARETIWANESYVFFRELPDDGVDAPRGVLDRPLTPGRSLAVDTAFHALGLPVYVSAPTLRHVDGCAPFRRLMVAQDVGSAIKGEERGDIFVGTGDEAGRRAGSIKHPGAFFVLLPRTTGPLVAP